MGLAVKRFIDAENVIVCRKCRTHFAEAGEAISKDFQGQHGRAYLYPSVINIIEGPDVIRTMTTGQHTVRDICCTVCETKVGWKYIKATEPSQKYKIGHYIVERALITDVERTVVNRDLT